MIIGHGIDEFDIRRMENNFGRYYSCFREEEVALCEGRLEGRMQCFTKRFCAKEACMKALGSDDKIGGVSLTDIEVVTMPSGRPTIRLHGTAQSQLHRITPSDHIAHIWVSISDDYPRALASVIIEALPIVSHNPASN